jgi:hypothetical protein
MRLWMYLMFSHPYADYTSDGEPIYRKISSPSEISAKIGVSRRTVEKDLAVLRDLNLYDYKVVEWWGHNKSAQRAKDASECLKSKRSKDGYLNAPAAMQPDNDLNSRDYDNLTANSAKNDQVHNIDRVRDQTIQTNTDLKETPSEKSENEKRKTVCTLEKPEETKLQSSALLTTKPETQQTNLTISSRNGLVVARRNESFYNRRVDPKDIEWDWVPAGPWKTEQGKLDFNFQTAIALEWQKTYGGTIHRKRKDVLAYFKKDPTNISDEWEWYQEDILQRAANIQTRKLAGVDTTRDEQEILKHGRATAQLPQEMRVTEERSPSQILQQVAPHILPAIAQDCQQVVLEPPKDKYGTINPAAYQPCITAEDTAYWQNVHARHASTENSDTGNTEQPPTAIDDGLSKAKALIESLTRKRERTKSLTSIADVFSPQEPYAATLEDMRKYLTSGSDTCRQIALDWASDPKNGCELVKVNGRVVDIREMEF